MYVILTRGIQTQVLPSAGYGVNLLRFRFFYAPVTPTIAIEWTIALTICWIVIAIIGLIASVNART